MAHQNSFWILTTITIDPIGEQLLIAVELRRYNIDIAALSETRFLDEGSLKEEGEGYTFWKGYPLGEQHQHGVGLAIKNSLFTETPSPKHLSA